MSRFEQNHRKPPVLKASVRIAACLLAGSIGSGVAFDHAKDEYAKWTEVGQSLPHLYDQAGYQPLLGDMNGPDAYDEPLAAAQEAYSDHQQNYLLGGIGLLLAVGATGTGVVLSGRALYTELRHIDVPAQVA